jgi:simple sugar transport system ATP-binding protein
MMVGRPVVFQVTKGEGKIGETVLSVRDLHVRDDRGLLAVSGASFDVRAGEILGLAGVEGNGQLELVEALWGLRKPVQGEIWIEGQKVKRQNPKKARKAGLGYIPQDRHGRGLILGFSVKENLVLGGHYERPYCAGPINFFLNSLRISDYCQQLVKEYSIRTPDLDVPVSSLSGGNQQKVIVARALGANPRLVIASQPTRGLDVGATEYIHNVLVRMRESGVAVLLVSADLDEILQLSDRIAVIYEGKIVAIKLPKKTSERELGLLMAGHERELAAES